MGHKKSYNRCNKPCEKDPCSTPIRYQGIDIDCAGIKQGDTIDSVIKKLTNKVCNVTYKNGDYIEVSPEPAGDNCEQGGISVVVKDGDTNKVLSTDYVCSAIPDCCYEEVTHSELEALIQGSELKRGAKYLITDYQTIYLQSDYEINRLLKPYTPSMVKTGTVEPLLVQATSNSTISLEAKSILFPDDIIEYLHESEVLEGTTTKGKIIRRRDKANNDIPFDFRQVKFKRYEVTPLSGKYFEYRDNGNDSDEFYFFANYNPSDPYAYEETCKNNTVARFGFEQKAQANNLWAISTVCFGDFQNNVIGADSRNNTFISDAYDNNIGQKCQDNLFSLFIDNEVGYEFQRNQFTLGIYMNFGSLSNIFKSYFQDNTIHGILQNNVFNSWFQENELGVEENGSQRIDDCNFGWFNRRNDIKRASNLITGEWFLDNNGDRMEDVTVGNYARYNSFGSLYAVTIGTDAWQNVFNNSSYENIGNNFYNNIFSINPINNGVADTDVESTSFSISAQQNFYGDGVGGNLFGYRFRNNRIKNNSDGNTFSNDFQNNDIGNNCNSNICYNNFKNNKIGNYFQANQVGESFGENKIGHFFSNNDIGDFFYLNTIGSYFQSNTIGHNFGVQGKGLSNGNIVGNFCTGNIIANSGILFSGNDSNTMGTDFSNNIINGESILNNDFGNEFRGNTIQANVDGASNFIENTFKNRTVSSVFNYGFQHNQIIGVRLRFINMLPLFIGNIIKVNSTGTSPLDFLDSTTSSLVYNANFTKEIVKRADGTYRLKYMDNTDAIVVVNITD